MLVTLRAMHMPVIDLLAGGLARFGTQHAHCTQTVSLASQQRCSGVKTYAGMGQHAVAIGMRFEQVVDHQYLRGVSDLTAAGALSRDLPVVDPDPRLEPLPVLVDRNGLEVALEIEPRKERQGLFSSRLLLGVTLLFIAL